VWGKLSRGHGKGFGITSAELLGIGLAWYLDRGSSCSDSDVSLFFTPLPTRPSFYLVRIRKRIAHPHAYLSRWALSGCSTTSCTREYSAIFHARASYGLRVLQIGQTAVEGSLLPLLWSHDPSFAIARHHILTDAAIPKPRFALDVYRLAHNDALIPWIFLFLFPLSLLRGRYRSLQLAAHDLVDVEIGRPYCLNSK